MTKSVPTVALTRWERKARLGHGAGRQIANELGVTESAVSKVLNGNSKSRRVEEAIASRIGLPVEVVFPKNQSAA